MGSYIYKVSSKAIGEYDGRPVFPATFAYKPWRGWDKGTAIENNRLAFISGVVSCERRWRKPEMEALRNIAIANGDDKTGYTLYPALHCDGSIVDDIVFDQPPLATGWFPPKKSRRSRVTT
jgi:hypothetical protein